MAKQPIKKINILALRKDEQALLTMLQHMGTIELITAEAKGWQAQQDETERIEQRAQTAQEAISILRMLRPEKKGLLPKTQTKWNMTAAQAEKMQAHGSLYERQCEEIVALQTELEQQKAERQELVQKRDRLTPWTALSMPLGGLITRHTVCLVGSVTGLWNEEELLQALWRIHPWMQAICVQTTAGPAGHTLVAVTGMKSEQEELRAALDQLGYTPCPFSGKEQAHQRIHKLQLAIHETEDEIQRLIQRLEGYADKPEPIAFAADMLAAACQRNRAMAKLAFSKDTVYVSGFIPEEKAQRVQEWLERRFPLACEICDPEEDEDVPVLLKNNRFVWPVESITKMYAWPGKKDLDPSAVMAFFYYLFFGMMLSDAGYGLVMLFGTSWALKKLSLSEQMRQSLRMFWYCGVSTTIWGVLFGSWFGDIIQVVGREFFGVEIGSLALWFEPIQDPIQLLLFSFALGIVHLYAGLAARFYLLWRQHRRWDAFWDVIPVFLLVGGAAPLAAGIFLTVPQTIHTIGTILAMIGAVLLLLTSGRSAKHLLAKLGGGVYGLYQTASGYLSDVLSYSRLLALGLATGSIASVVNLMGTMPENMVVKAVLLVVVFCVGHAVNLAINLLGAYVHTNRLQFVELFSKFYEGGGRPFVPFAAPEQYTHIEEEVG